MSNIKFELKEDHFKLLKHLSWNELTEDKQITTAGTNSPFGGLTTTKILVLSYSDNLKTLTHMRVTHLNGQRNRRKK